MAIQIVDYDSLKQYFSNVATAHLDINSFHFGDSETFMNAVKSNMDVPVIWLDIHDPVTVIDNLSDNFMGEKKTSIYIIDVAIDDKYTSRQAKYVELEAIAKDVISRILRDWNNGDLFTKFSNYVYGPMSDIKGAVRYIGCRIDLNFQVPLRLAYNEAKWQ